MGGIERGWHNIAIMNLLKIADALEMKASSLPCQNSVDMLLDDFAKTPYNQANENN